MTFEPIGIAESEAEGWVAETGSVLDGQVVREVVE